MVVGHCRCRSCCCCCGGGGGGGRSDEDHSGGKLGSSLRSPRWRAPPQSRSCPTGTSGDCPTVQKFASAEKKVKTLNRFETQVQTQRHYQQHAWRSSTLQTTLPPSPLPPPLPPPPTTLSTSSTNEHSSRCFTGAFGALNQQMGDRGASCIFFYRCSYHSAVAQSLASPPPLVIHQPPKKNESRNNPTKRIA